MDDELEGVDSLHYNESRVLCTYAQRQKMTCTIIAHVKYG